MQVKWKKCISAPFHVSNGVRQGSIFSPALFNFYKNDLLKQLNMCRTGCTVGRAVVNHLTYADDLVVFSPSSAGLQHLLNICSAYGYIKYNVAKKCRNDM